MLIAAAFYTAADEDLDFLVDYAQAGGHLVVGPRTGFGDEEGRARTERAPARLTDAAGVWYDEMASLPSPVPAAGSLPGAATGFAEGLVASDAEVLAGYQHPHLSRWAAVTTRAAGAGRITVVGTVPDQNLAAGLVRWLAPRGVDGWTTDDSVTVSTCTDTAGTSAACSAQLELGGGSGFAILDADRRAGRRAAHARRASHARALGRPALPLTLGQQ